MALMKELTIFHKILAGEIPAEIVFEDNEVLVFKDINPKAVTHLLLIPRKKEDFVASIADLDESVGHVPGMLVKKAKEVAEKFGIDGYKLQFNVGKEGGQEVFFLHLHFLSNQPIKR